MAVRTKPLDSFVQDFAKVAIMRAMLQDLIYHKGYADSALLRAIRRNDNAGHDDDLRRLLHHIILANRFWLMQNLGRPFALEEESRVPDAIGTIATRYRETHVEELEWICKLAETDLDNKLECPFIPGGICSVAEAVMQVCMHSHGHRSQCATRLRLLGGTPPAMDFILWLKNRPNADWS